jgi:hypothetical protein
MNPVTYTIETTRRLLADEGFKSRHRASDQAFTRVRCLPVAVVLVLILRKSVQSLQNVVNEAMAWLRVDPVTASAFSQARYQLQHPAFIELNQKAVVESRYRAADFRTFWGLRVLGIDGSKVRLPDTEAVRAAFGTLAYSNGKDAQIQGEHPYALASALYDVLNRVALEATLGRADAYEVDLAIGHLVHTGPADWLVMDRNYPAYRLLAELTRRERHFVIRCSAASFGAARRMLQGQGPDSQVVTLTPCAAPAPLIRQRGLPRALTVRLVRGRLSTGEWAVLVTSLRDEAAYPTAGFLALYPWRWGVETF